MSGLPVTVRLGDTVVALDREPTVGVLWRFFPAVQAANDEAADPIARFNAFRQVGVLLAEELGVPFAQIERLTRAELVAAIEDFSLWVSAPSQPKP